jgi:PAS domain S-box-containing protein
VYYEPALDRSIAETLIAATTALRESEARFRTLAEASPDSITVISRGRFVYANPATAAVLGFDNPEEFLARPVDQLLVDPEESAIMAERIGRIVRGERLPPREYGGRRKDGSVAVMEISTSLIQYDGAPAILSFGRDTTERRAWHAELMRADRLATIGMLSASVAHEINNPLTYTLLHLERMALTVPQQIADPAARRQVETMIAEAREGGERVRAIVRDLLSVARHDDDVAPVSVEAALDTALKLAGPTVATRAEVIRRCQPVPPVRASIGRLGQVLLNLILNAADAFERDAPGNRVEIEIGRDGEVVVVAVTDNGRGIGPDVLPRIFEPLFTTKPLGAGTGLGLSICKTIVTELGGTITARSTLGSGTRVEVRLPAERSPEAAPPPPPPAAQPRRRIAVIDDDRILADALTALVALRHHADPFIEPRSALASLTVGEVYDHVLCDVNMPSMHGVDLYLQLVERRPEYARRFTFITGGGPSLRTEAVVARGEAALLHKPFDFETLMAAIERPAAEPGRGA